MKIEMRSEANYKIALIFMWALILLFGVLFFAKVIPLEQKPANVAEYGAGWYYIQDGEKIHIALPGEIDLMDWESTAIYNDSLASDHAGEYLFVKNAIYRPEIYLDDEPLYQYEDGGLRRNPPELSYQICKGAVKSNVEGGIVKIVYHKSTNATISLPMVYTGDADAVVRDLFFRYAYITVITISLIMLGIFSFAVGIITIRQKYAYNRKLLMLGLFLLVIGVWCLTDSPLVQYVLDYSNVNMYVDFFIFMFLVAPFLGYIKTFSGMEKYGSLNCVLLLSLCNPIVQTILARRGVFTYFEMVPATHVIIVVAVLLSIFLLCREYILRKNREIFLCFRAFAMAGGFSIVSIIMYFIIPEIFYQNFLQTGLLLFVLILLWNIVSDFIKSFQYRTEANNYRLLAEVDRLTGLKNRRGFDLKIAEIVKDIEKCDNVLLIFMDMNGLKMINDLYGHTKGDEVIIAAAGCIRGAYSNHGFCYRVGGDEFCAIIENPLFSEQDAISFLEHEVKKCNRELHDDCRFSMAVGCSFLKSGGAVKEIAKWKEDADRKMYEDKRMKKLQEIRIAYPDAVTFDRV